MFLTENPGVDHVAEVTRKQPPDRQTVLGLAATLERCGVSLWYLPSGIPRYEVYEVDGSEEGVWVGGSDANETN